MFLKNKEYNPKIDYLLCKYLIKNLPEPIDENHLKDCFFNKASCQTEADLNLCMIRNFFLQHDLLTFHKKEIQMLFEYLEISYEFNGFIGKRVEEKVFYILQDLRNIENKRLIIKVLLVMVYIEEKGEILLPYPKGISSLLMASTIEDVKRILAYLEKKTQKLNRTHDVRLNSKIPSILKILAPYFLEITGYLGVGVYGSFSLGTTNKYSDLDLLVIVSKESNERYARRKSKRFFRAFLPLSMDIKVTTLEKMESEITIGMKKTIKIIGGSVQWKKSMN